MSKVINIERAMLRISPYVHYTPVLTNSSLNNLTESSLFFKCENFQRSGSFKIRGATNAILQLSKSELDKGVITVSSGNHGAALSMALSLMGGTAKVIMPKNTPKVKVDNVIRNGGKIIWCEPNYKSREEILKKVLKDTGSIIVHPYNDLKIVEGQGTVALELIEKCKDLDIIISPVSGGGLLSGVLCFISEINKKIKVYGAEPIEADDTHRSILYGKIQKNKTTNTICDGLRAQVGTITFPIIKEKVSDILTVSEEDIISSMRLIWERMKIIVEPSCSITLAAILKNKNIFKGKKVGLILSGGNVDLNQMPWKVN